MAFTEKTQNHTSEKVENIRGTDHSGENYSGIGLPNSLMLDLYYGDGDNNSNSSSVIQRQMSMSHRQIPSAEAEADRLSAGVRGRSPEAVRREMGTRLNANLSDIRFHSDAASRASNARMGSRAWTSGRDIYFGQNGFEPQIAAHELVHTVQQGAARGKVTQSVAPGTVQMWWPFGKKESKFDKDTTPEDIADNLFRIQAGYTATEEREQEERSAAYAKTYAGETKRLEKANRNRIREEGAEEQDKELARNNAANSAKNLRVKKKYYVKDKDTNNFIAQVKNISRETYKELLDRRKNAAEELVRFYNSQDATPGKSSYMAANSTQGKTFNLYDQLITKVEMANSIRDDFKSWQNQFRNISGGADDPVEEAKLIMRQGNSAENSYMKSDEAIRGREKTHWSNK